MKMKKFLSLLTIVVMLSVSAIDVRAEENIGFDPAYYANEYPDVVAKFGYDPTLLYQHYVLFGVKEGRFQNQYEEDNQLTNTSNINVINTHNIQPIVGYSTYVDIDISDQVVTYFQNNEVLFQSSCVSGLNNGKRNTPYGTYKILTKVPGKRLKGPTWNCWVDRWMKFTNSNIGLHDASWRSSFGGEIYQTNGSHGCCNLPHDAAMTAGELLTYGSKVLVKK